MAVVDLKFAPAQRSKKIQCHFVTYGTFEKT